MGRGLWGVSPSGESGDCRESQEDFKSFGATLKKCNNLEESQCLSILAKLSDSCAKTGMAQRQRAGLITPRSQDRNLLPVYVFSKKNLFFFLVKNGPCCPIFSQ